jgi:hypothetical protein
MRDLEGSGLVLVLSQHLRIQHILRANSLLAHVEV